MSTKLAEAAVVRAGCLISGHFVFAAREHSLQKLELDNLWNHPRELAVILNQLARADGLPPADAILGVPTGGQRLAEALARPSYTRLPLIRLERIPGGTKQDFRFMSQADQTLAHEAASLRIYEDVVTTLSSIAGVVRLLNPNRQTIHSLAVWRRGTPRPQYRTGFTDHYLIEKLLSSFEPTACPYPNCPNYRAQTV